MLFISFLLCFILCRCPVCNVNLSEIGSPEEQEIHVKACLEGGTGTAPHLAKYLVYELPSESTLVGAECEFMLQSRDDYNYNTSYRRHLFGRVCGGFADRSIELLLQLPQKSDRLYNLLC